MKAKVVEVKWEDAWIDTEDVLIVEAKRLKPVLRSTVGWLVSESDNEIVLATDIYHTPKEKDYVNSIMVIPKGMVLNYWEYELNESVDS